jgi:hypothetical protein
MEDHRTSQFSRAAASCLEVITEERKMNDKEQNKKTRILAILATVLLALNVALVAIALAVIDK